MAFVATGPPGSDRAIGAGVVDRGPIRARPPTSVTGLAVAADDAGVGPEPSESVDTTLGPSGRKASTPANVARATIDTAAATWAKPWGHRRTEGRTARSSARWRATTGSGGGVR